MNVDRVVKQLKTKYSGKNIVINKGDEYVEVLCEVAPTTDHESWSMAISVIDKSAPHYHKNTTETYKVLKGKLSVNLDGKVVEINKGEELVINPGVVHSAIGDETWIECHSTPGWESSDYYLT